MADRIRHHTLGIDVAKEKLVLFHWQQQSHSTCANTPKAIQKLLRQLPPGTELAVEPTNTYHLELVQQACERGLAVYLIDTRRVRHYAAAVGQLDKTDPDDARLLARYLERERASLRAHTPQDRRARELWALVQRQGNVVKHRQSMEQSFRGSGIAYRGVVSAMNQLQDRIQRRIERLIQQLGWGQDLAVCQSIPGIGPATGAALVAAYHRSAFASVDGYIAFMGLSIRRRESGRYRGKSKLTKCGEPELRRLLFCAAQGATTHPRFHQFWQQQKDKGLTKIGAKMALGRKLARIAFALISKQERYQWEGQAY